MARDLEAKTTRIEILDRTLEHPTVVLVARQPTPREHYLFQANKIVREGNTIISRAHLVRQEYGAAILQSLEKNPSLQAGGRPVSSDPDDPDYRADWIELLQKGAPVYIDVVARTMFESIDSAPSGGKPEDLTFEVAEAPAEPEDEVLEEIDVPLSS